MVIPLIGLQSTNSFHRNRFNPAHFYFGALWLDRVALLFLMDYGRMPP
ncbi:uncharacterized protein FTOL_13946 [Fusarium torulosum]|uniref:Uncharacterized protein n=1 Tax=Fusarium torulosum TaxID=33205 RepID=A0AAE8MND9_9HYPO|nr:uncharacterized protein FTOL_13946 [Fusarium torulosum]